MTLQYLASRKKPFKGKKKTDEGVSVNSLSIEGILDFNERNFSYQLQSLNRFSCVSATRLLQVACLSFKVKFDRYTIKLQIDVHNFKHIGSALNFYEKKCDFINLL